ncbi:MscS family membrane protein [Filimonas lacunae]|uniref:MscS family membrane protein n=1 Tax=Filimonas lacunae TaxID=477680 RepID=A0A173MQI2_9BACT|nr:mechanosensitive ion channel domain-containing protein [Filimonas lacunae]BAV09923.1 mechanosensitive ion channel protein MscS [Filimonas lacunae]SIS81126.1 MscS family membrane protein [Filimonas lacunae]
MKELLQRSIFGNTIETYLIVATSIAIALLVKRFVSKYLAILLFKIFTKAGKTFHKAYFLQLVVSPLEWFLALFMIVVALDKLHLPFFLDFKIYRADSRDIIDAVTNATLIIIFIRLCVRVVQFFGMILEEKARESQADSQLVVFFKDFFRVILIIIGILLILRFSFHYNISNLLTGLSIVGAAIALATKESLENLIASFIIFFDKPFTTGDTVKVNSFTGAVEKIGLRSTRIRTDQKTYITVPNKQMVDSILDNITLRSQRKVELRLEVGLSATVPQLQALIANIKQILKQDDVISNSVFLSDTGKNAHIITVDYFTAMHQTTEEFNQFREKVNFAIIDLLAQKETALAAASADVVIHQAQP